jgi:hypothetical protein
MLPKALGTVRGATRRQVLHGTVGGVASLATVGWPRRMAHAAVQPRLLSIVSRDTAG